MRLRDFSGGLNTFDANINIADNQCASLLNVCYEEGDILRSRYGFSQKRSVSNVRGLYNWYKNSVLHQIYTTTSGLYDNGTRLTASFTGAFHAQEYASMLYLVNGTYNKRYDGTTLYNWGIDAPDAPTVAASVKTDITIEDFEDAAASYVRYDYYGTITARTMESTASLVYEGSQSMKLSIPANSGARFRRMYSPARALNLRDFGGVAGGDDDYITMRMWIDNPNDFGAIKLIFWDRSSSPIYTVFNSGTIKPGEYYQSKLINKYEDNVLTEEQIQVQYLPEVESGWAKLKIPKADFDNGGHDGDWSDIRRVYWHVSGKSSMESAPCVVYFDDMKVEGGPGDNTGLYGKFRCVAGYYNSSRDEYFGVSTESDEVELDVQGIKITGVPSSFDDQADTYIVWARKTGSVESETTVDAWTGWYKVAEISEGTTSDVSVINNVDLLLEDELTATTGIFPANMISGGVAYTRVGTNNIKPPVADNICIHRGKCFFAVDDKVYHSKDLAPWAVPAGHYIVATSDADPIQSFYSDGMDLSVFSKTKDFSYLMAGEYDSQNIYNGTLIEARDFKRGCIAPHATCDGLYVSSQGICYWDGQHGQIISKRIKPTFSGISTKTTLHGVVWEDLYLLTNPGGDSIVCEQYDTQNGKAVRFYLWAFSSTVRCCAVDRITNLLYIGTDTGIYYYDTSKYKDYEGNFTMRARLKNYEYAPEDQDAPLQRFTVHSNTGGNAVSTSIFVDGVSHGSSSINTTTRQETEAFVDLGGAGSFVQPRFNGTVSQTSPVRIYGIEIS